MTPPLERPTDDEPATEASDLEGAVASTFVFEQYRTDEAFEELNRRVEEVARSTPGYLGRKDWTDAEENPAVTYYWESLEALRRFARDPDHREAKRRHREWYAGYRVEVSRVLTVYGSGELDDPFGSPEADEGSVGERPLGPGEGADGDG